MIEHEHQPGDCEDCPEADFEFCEEHAQCEIDDLRRRANKAETETARLKEWLKETRDAGHEFYKKDVNAYTHWGDLADEIDELLKVNQ